MSKSVLLVLFPIKFTKFYYYLLDIDRIKKVKKLKVEIHDLSNDLNKKFNKGFLAKSSKQSVKFSDYGQWKKRLNQLNQKYNLVIFNFLDFNSFRSLKYFSYIKKHKLKVLRIGSSGVIEDSFNKKKSLSYYLANLKNLNVLFKKIFYNIKSKIIIFFYKSFFRLDEILLISGNEKQKIFNLSNIENKFKFHSLDYNKALQIQKTKKTKQENMILYFDQPKPYFYDDYQLFYGIFKKPNVKIVQEHYNKLNFFLRSVEKVYKLKVVIIPHPKVRGLKNPYYNKHFKVDQRANAAIKLIPKSKFVIYSSFSTSVAYSIACTKPIIFLKTTSIGGSSAINEQYVEGINQMSKFLSCKMLDYSKQISKKLPIYINKKKYDKYKYQFLTSKKLSKIENYHIIKKIIEK